MPVKGVKTELVVAYWKYGGKCDEQIEMRHKATENASV